MTLQVNLLSRSCDCLSHLSDEIKCTLPYAYVTDCAGVCCFLEYSSYWGQNSLLSRYQFRKMRIFLLRVKTSFLTILFFLFIHRLEAKYLGICMKRINMLCLSEISEIWNYDTLKWNKSNNIDKLKQKFTVQFDEKFWYMFHVFLQIAWHSSTCQCLLCQ